jgi:NADH dehydrogenase
VHTFGAEAVALAAAAFGARLVHVSAIGADPDSPSHYARSKAMGEQLVLSAMPSATILRPSIVFGPEDDFFNKFAALARLAPALPLIGGGETRFQPVFAGDVAAAVLAAIDRPQAGDHPEAGDRPGAGRAIYELGGPEVKSFKELMQFVLAVTERRRLLVPIPFGLGRVMARVLELPTKLLAIKPMLTPDQVEMLTRDNVVSEPATQAGRTLTGLGIEPVAMGAVVPTYLWRFRKYGQFSTGVA